MTDKEIIINGVDVSGCQFRDTPYFSPCGGCKNDDNCYYKQLQRKTKECEELKKQLMQKDEVDIFFNTPVENWSNNPCEICQYKNEYKRYEQALEEIKKYTREQFCDNCEDINSTEYTCHCEHCEYQEYFEIINKAKDINVPHKKDGE